VSHVRRATATDAPELVRLRRMMLAEVDGAEPAPVEWLATTEATLRQRLCDGDPMLAAFVIDKPEQPDQPDEQDRQDEQDRPDGRRAVAACAVGIVLDLLPSPGNASGQVGYVMNVATDPAYRRRGYSRACVQALVDWFAGRGVLTVDLRASSEGEPLYRDLGFRPMTWPGMRLRLTAAS
jgi:GNAT superfamily N-acetyltransferase